MVNPSHTPNLLEVNLFLTVLYIWSILFLKVIEPLVALALDANWRIDYLFSRESSCFPDKYLRCFTLFCRQHWNIASELENGLSF